jgi:uncharacterized protein YbjT (DUF2867 family)
MILITGATGNVGRPLVELLAAQGAKVRAVTRNPDPDLPAGVEVEPAASLDGVTTLFLNPRAVGKSVGYLVARACAQGVQRIVALSATNVDDDFSAQPSRYRGDFNKEVETATVESGLEWVSLRPTMFCSNAIGLWASQIAGGDTVYGPYPDATWSPINERDIAGVAAHAILNDDLLGQRVELSGPESLTQHEMVTIIGEVIGRNLTYQEVSADVARKGLVPEGYPTAFADALLTILAKAVGKPALVTDAVATILGRPALTFTDWVTDNKEVFHR